MSSTVADSTILLFYNDYGLKIPCPKLTAVLCELNQVRAYGIRVDGSGLQMHLSLDSPEPEQ